MTERTRWGRLALLWCLAAASTAGQANALREKGKAVSVAGSALTVSPARDWNQLSAKPGKVAETWTLDGEQLNDVTFYGGIEPGKPLVKERNRKREPLPAFRAGTLLIEVPELLAGTYRAYKQIGDFKLTSTTPTTFLGSKGVIFTYDYLDKDELPRRGEARAAIVNGRLFMISYDAPRLHFFDRNIADFRSLADATHLN